MQIKERAEPDVVVVKRALLSVSDKDGLVPFARGLADRGVELVSTGGTAKALRDAGLVVRTIDELTGFPEMMEGRVKTLHPKVHGGLLGVRTDPEHARAMREHAIEPIDLVCVNLYPFEATVAKPDCSRAMAIENIDIGGPSMLRSAAKNHAFVAVVTSPSHYALVLHELREHGGTTLRTRRALAAQTFAITAAYDGAIARHFAGDCTSQSASEVSLPSDLMLQLRKVSDLRHGENPQQLGALYARASATALTHAHAPAPAQGLPDITTATQLHGKELSYNNLLDASAAIELAHALTSLCDKHASVFAQVLGAGAQPFGAAVGVGGDVGSGVGLGVGLGVGACVIKHTNPCGAAIALGAGEAVRQAIAGDPVAAYGGILAVGGRIDLASAETIVKKEHFFEVVAAPSFDEDALALLRSRWQNVRLLALPSWNPKAAAGMSAGDSEQPQQLELRTIAGGMLAQTKDVLTTELAQFAHAAGPAPTSDAIACGAFLEVVGKALLSNAVVLGGVEIASSEGAASQVGASAGGSANIDATTPRALRMYGAGAGQMDRVASCTLALLKAGDRARGAVAYSDAFFPFADGPTLLVQAGVRTIVHPGGSKRDSDTFALCNDRGVTCVTTGARHFRH